MNIVNLITISSLALAISGSITSQTQKPVEPSAEKVAAGGFRAAGGLVNATEGEVQCRCGGEETTSVRAGQEFANGDTVQTGKDGRVEILLNPGYYLRLFNNTRASLVDLSPGNLKIKLLYGSAIFEVSTADSPSRSYVSNEVIYAPITVFTSRDEYAIVDRGVYRFNVQADAGSSVRVISKGLVVVAGTRVKDGTIASVLNGRVDVAPADKQVMDAFDNWSRDRSAGLVQSNKSLQKADWFKQIKKDRAYLGVQTRDAAAQANARHTIYARNGLVAFVESGATLNPGEREWEELKAGDSLISGARVRTSAESRVELRPHPNFCLFMGSNTEIIYSENEDGQVSVAVVKGSVIVISQSESTDPEPHALTLTAERIEYEISGRGHYRLNVMDGKTEMLIYDGAVKVAGKAIKSGKRFVHDASAEAVLPLDKQALDGFVIWSNRRMIMSAVGVVRRWLTMAGGLWLLNQSTGEYTFVPGLWEYSSPYGGSYLVTYADARELYMRAVAPAGNNHIPSVWRPRGAP